MVSDSLPKRIAQRKRAVKVGSLKRRGITAKFLQKYKIPIRREFGIDNRKEGVVDSILLRFTDIWGKQKVSNPNFREGVNPHIWTDSGKSEWYVFHPGAADYQKVADTVENYLSVFQDMAMTQESQDCTMQMGT